MPARTSFPDYQLTRGARIGIEPTAGSACAPILSCRLHRSSGHGLTALSVLTKFAFRVSRRRTCPCAAGLWTRGTGKVVTPPASSLFFLPQKPYMPLGPLRSQLLFPSGAPTSPAHPPASSATPSHLQPYPSFAVVLAHTASKRPPSVLCPLLNTRSSALPHLGITTRAHRLTPCSLIHWQGRLCVNLSSGQA